MFYNGIPTTHHRSISIIAVEMKKVVNILSPDMISEVLEKISYVLDLLCSLLYN